MVTKRVDVQHMQSVQELLALLDSDTEIILSDGDKVVGRLTPVEETIRPLQLWPIDDESGAVQPPLIQEDVETQLDSLRKAFAEMREGLSDDERRAMIDAINYESVEPFDPTLFGREDETEDRP